MGIPLRTKGRIQTERLTRKPYSPQDAAALTGLLTHAEIARFFMVPDFETMEQATAYAEKLMRFSQTDDTQHLEYGIYLAEQLIGFVHDCGMGFRKVTAGCFTDNTASRRVMEPCGMKPTGLVSEEYRHILHPRYDYAIGWPKQPTQHTTE